MAIIGEDKLWMTTTISHSLSHGAFFLAIDQDCQLSEKIFRLKQQRKYDTMWCFMLLAYF